jgi:hypothetical protein
VERAKSGDVEALPRLRQLLKKYPVLWESCGDLARQAEKAWLKLVGGTNLHLRECVENKAAALREELAGPRPTPVVRLLADRAVSCWLQMHYFDAIEPEAIAAQEAPRLAAFRASRQLQAHRMYVSALASLTAVRRLLPPPVTESLPARGYDGAPKSKPDGAQARDGMIDSPPAARNRVARYLAELDEFDTKNPSKSKACASGASN